MLDPYQCLELEATAQADQILVAFRKLALASHPDSPKGRADQGKRFLAVCGAYWELNRRKSLVGHEQLARLSPTLDQSDGLSIDKSSADAVFVEVLACMVYAQLKNLSSRRRILVALSRLGCPQSAAEAVARLVSKRRNGAIRTQAISALFGGLGLIATGAAVTLISQSLARPGGRYVITTGLFLVGGVSLLGGLFMLIFGRFVRTWK